MADEKSFHHTVDIVGSQTAQDYIARQLELESEAKEALPYQFDTCTKALGPLRQSVFACLTCHPSEGPKPSPFIPAGICYACSVSCHGEHNLVELFTKRDFECDCGTTRFESSIPCTLRSNATTAVRGVSGEPARADNQYNQNFEGRFCACGELYDPENEKGTMFQCLGLGNISEGGCGEDWWHPECLMGLPRSKTTTGEKQTMPSEGVEETTEIWNAPAGFPSEDDFDHLICYKCLEGKDWLKRYAGSDGFLPALLVSKHQDSIDSHVLESSINSNGKRKSETGDTSDNLVAKRAKVDFTQDLTTSQQVTTDDPKQESQNKPSSARHEQLSPNLTCEPFSLLLKEDFRDHLCRCKDCFPRLSRYPPLLEAEEVYEPPRSEDDNQPGDTGSIGSKSLLDMGEAALGTMDRTRAIEGVMAYNHLKEKVKAFLAPFAESGTPVGAEDVKAYFAKLRGDDEAIKMGVSHQGDDSVSDDHRKDQEGY